MSHFYKRKASQIIKNQVFKKASNNLLFTGFCIFSAIPSMANQTIEQPNSTQIKTAGENLTIPLANNYHPNIDIKNYWFSEKLDGIRAYWNGEAFYSRQGHIINTPLWFTQSMPKQALDGELWAGRGNFSVVQKTVLDFTPNDNEWQHITFMAFDAPLIKNDTENKLTFNQRYLYLKDLIDPKHPHLKLVEHFPIQSHQELTQKLKQIEALKGEGLMLRRIDGIYLAGRSDAWLKMKSYQDDEAIVIGYKDGKGQFEGKVGALKVRGKNGKVFYLGSGLTHEDRENPPKLGSVVNFRYNGFTSNGLPKFARYVRLDNSIVME